MILYAMYYRSQESGKEWFLWMSDYKTEKQCHDAGVWLMDNFSATQTRVVPYKANQKPQRPSAED